MFFCRSLIRTFVVGGLGLGVAGGALAMVAGPERAVTLVGQVQDRVQHHIDAQIDDPTALRSQLRKLEAEYPERISELTGDLAELDQQISQLERERQISEKVVELASADLMQAEEHLARGSVALASTEGDSSYAYSQAMNRASQLRQTQAVYTSRANDAQRDLGYLQDQGQRMRDALAQLETEHAQFQAQLWQIERQVDAIARNERLIGMMEERQKELDEHSRYEAASLDHLTGRLSEIRTRQEAQLQLLSKAQKQVSYEDLARLQIDNEEFRTEAGYEEEACYELVPTKR
ncbi:MAG: hypothetical protein AAFZ65_03295 [Planctomycetota bacterium]